MKVRSGRRAESELTERQRHWLGHLRAAQRKDEPLTVYAEQRGLSVSSLYEAKRQLQGGHHCGRQRAENARASGSEVRFGLGPRARPLRERNGSAGPTE